jgi:hypothetical protein
MDSTSTLNGCALWLAAADHGKRSGFAGDHRRRVERERPPESVKRLIEFGTLLLPLIVESNPGFRIAAGVHSQDIVSRV